MIWKTRIILSAVIIACVSAGMALWEYLPLVEISYGEALPFALVFAVLFFLFTGALTMFIATFCGVRMLPDGKFCYNPRNFWWRLMSWFYGSSWSKEIAFCKAYWLTDIFTFVASVAVLIIGGVLWFLFNVGNDVLILVGVQGGTIGGSSGALFSFLSILVISLVIFGGVVLVSWLSNRTDWFRWIGMTILVGLHVGVIGIFIVFPVLKIIANQNITLGPALLVYGKYVLMTIGTVVPAVLVCVGIYYFFVRLVFKAFSKLRDTWLGQLYLYLHKQFCPIMVECKIPQRKKSTQV